MFGMLELIGLVLLLWVIAGFGVIAVMNIIKTAMRY